MSDQVIVLRCPDCGKPTERCVIVPKRDDEPEYWVFDCKHCGYYQWVAQRER